MATDQPITPYAAWPDTNAKIFPGPHIGATNSRIDGGGMSAQVMASLDANSTWHLRWNIPNPLPSGTAKLLLRALADNTS